MAEKPDFSKVPIKPAATVILLRDSNEGLLTLLLRRNSKLTFAGGTWVFPGGRFEASDFDEAGSQQENAAAPFAAARETLEETGLRVKADDFVYFSHWTTPPVMPKRFSTWFFLTRASGHEEVTVDGSEIEDHVWVTPENALLLHAKQEIELLPPTFVSLTELLAFESADQALQAIANRTAFVFEPRFGKQGDDTVALYAEDAGYEHSDANAPGSRHRCVMRPGEWRYERSA
ncbi:MAG: NUDIX domain-containing protein [Pseudomonadales bacterium]